MVLPQWFLIVAAIYRISPELILNLPFLAGKAAEYPHCSITFLLDCDVKRDALWDVVI